MRLDAEVLTKALEVPIEVLDADARMLGGDGNRQIRGGEAIGAVGADGCKLAHRRQDRTLHTAIHRFLAQAVQHALDCGTKAIRTGASTAYDPTGADSLSSMNNPIRAWLPTGDSKDVVSEEVDWGLIDHDSAGGRRGKR